jgi:hypothetical protein
MTHEPASQRTCEKMLLFDPQRVCWTSGPGTLELKAERAGVAKQVLASIPGRDERSGGGMLAIAHPMEDSVLPNHGNSRPETIGQNFMILRTDYFQTRLTTRGIRQQGYGRGLTREVTALQN